jgi:hypothetical protein
MRGSFQVPCHDVTELISLELDVDERLASYSLTKGTCSGGVGEAALLLDLVKGRSLDEILTGDGELFDPETPFKSTVKEFLHYKHLVALRAALAALVGQESPYRDRVCELDQIDYGPDGVKIFGRIRVDLLTEEIKACGRCAGCKTG